MSFFKKLISKSLRYKNMAVHFENWPRFIAFKITAKEGDAFTFKLRNSFEITVEKKMLGPFRDCFFDEKYLKHININEQKDKELTIVDIGANVGYFSLYALYKFPKAKEFSFEPMPFCFHQLQQYAKEYRNMSLSVFNYAVGKEDGTIDFYVKDEDQFSTDSSIIPDSNRKRIGVKTIKWHSLINLIKIKKVDILKLDCEGSEYPILYNLSAEEFSRIDAITIEAHDVHSETENMTKLVELLRKNNFEVEHEAVVNLRDGGHIWAKRII